MATLKNVTINDTGYVRVPQGTSAQRPSTPTVTLSAAFLSPLGISRDGLQLYITSTTPSVASNTWQHYQNLPDYLKNLQTTRGINETDGANITFSDATLVYMLRVPTWNAVDTTGWTTVETAKQYIGGETNVSVFSKTFSAGTYSFDNNSAMYLFSPVSAGTTTSVGAMRFNTTYGINEVWTGSEWKSLTGKTVSATGGNTIEGAVTVGGYKVHTFTSNGTFTPTYSGTVDLLLVAGGGCGAGLSGGGGAGGFIYLSNYQVSGGVPYTIQVGTGGPGPSSHSPGSGATSGQGNPSYFNGSGTQGIQALGGGHGGYWTGAAAPGGSGGGGPGHNYSPGQRPAGNGTYGQGHPGGYGHHGGGPASNLSPQPGICIYGGGGGGGAGHKGHERKSWGAEAKGGDGLGNSIYGEKTAYYAGGGAGGSHGPSGNYGRDRSVGGLGGGGGSGSGGPQSFLDARPGSGGGGGGAWHPDTYRSGNGGSGIVIVRYRT